MKRFKFLQVALIAVLVVAAVSCGIPRSVSDEYYDDYPSGNVYYGNPYGAPPVILQRDPFTGQYYQVTPYGAYAYPSTPYYGYNRGYRYRNNNHYGNRGGYNGGYNNNDGRYNNNNNNRNNNSGQTDAQREQKREEARDKILGGRH